MFKKEIGGKEYTQLELDDVLNAKNLGDDHYVNDWPWGRKEACVMHFYVESSKKGERFVKQSTSPKGRLNKPKKHTYANRVRLIEIDGKIGRVEWRQGFVSVTMEDSKFVETTFWSQDGIEIAKKFFDYSIGK